MLWFAGIVAFFAIGVPFWMHLLEYTLIALGALTVGIVAGAWYWRHHLPRRRAQAQRIGLEWQQQAAMANQNRQPLPAAQQPAIPQGNVANYYGHTLALPGDWTPEQIRAFRGE